MQIFKQSLKLLKLNKNFKEFGEYRSKLQWENFKQFF